MEGVRTIRSVSLQEFLSFGSDRETIELQPLNVLIGPNASGKSNFIEAFRILNAAPDDVGKPIREGGGATEYYWKGGNTVAVPDLEVIVEWGSDYSLLYFLRFMGELFTFYMIEEAVEAYPIGSPPELIYRLYNNGYGELYSKGTKDIPSQESQYIRENITPDKSRSVLNQVTHPTRYPALSRLREVFSGIHFYTGWDLGRFGTLRLPQKADLPSTSLMEDGSNLGHVLINKPSSLRQDITERLKIVLPTVEEIFPRIEGGAIPLFIREKGFRTPISAKRLSEGTLRYLCLLTLLLDPTPPPVICLEEPEVGLHPDVIHTIADLLIDGSQRTQLIVTTHSDKLISALANAGATEAVIVCERQEKGTRLHRLEPQRLKKWLDKYSLGELWAMGEIGGTRW